MQNANRVANLYIDFCASKIYHLIMRRIWIVILALSLSLYGEINSKDRHWCVYYGWPSAHTIDEWANYKVIVFARDIVDYDHDGWSDTLHPDYSNTVNIIQSLKGTNFNEIDGSCDFYGYIHIGRAGYTWAYELSIDQIEDWIDRWQSMGCEGIFFDESGNDYGVTDSLRNIISEYAHNKGMRVIWNAWEISDLKTTNWQDKDGWCVESFLVYGNGDSTITTDGSNEFKKYNDLREIEDSLNIDILGYVLSTEYGGYTDFSSQESINRQHYAWWGVLLFNYDFFQYTDIYYSSSNNYLYYFNQIQDSIGDTYTTEVIQHSDSTYYTRETDKVELFLNGYNKTSGYNGLSFEYQIHTVRSRTYPNNFISFSYPFLVFKKNGDYNISIISLCGRKEMEDHLYISQTPYKYILPISKLPYGIYLINVYNSTSNKIFKLLHFHTQQSK